jgi:hypothetical protein
VVSSIFAKELHAGLAAASKGSGKSIVGRAATVLLLGLMLFAGLGIANPERSTAGQAGTINTNNVEVFEHPTDLTVITYVSSGDRVDIFWGPEWEMYEVRTSDGTVGWVWAEFLDLDGSGEATYEEPAAEASSSSAADEANVWSWSAWAMVDADSLNVRNDASSSASVIDTYGPGEWIEVIGDDVNGFSPINYGGDVAWVASMYLSWDGTYNYATVNSGGGTGGGSSDTGNSGGEHWIDVNGGTGEVNLMIGNVSQATYWGSVGFDKSTDGFYSTANGTFYVYAMYEPLAYTKWADAYITNWVGFDSSRSNGFHSYSKDANGNVLPNGAGKTGGCVALSAGAIQAVYDFAYIGMRVEVHR